MEVLFFLGFIFLVTMTNVSTAKEDLALSSHKEKVEELFEHNYENHGNKNRTPMFTFPMNRFSSDKKIQEQNATKEDERYKKLLDRIIKLEAQLAQKEKTKSQNKPTQENWEDELDRDLEIQKNKSKKIKDPNNNETNSTQDNGNLEEWEIQLERELKQQKNLSKKSEN